MDDTNPAQSEFDKKYITAWEVMRTVGVTRAALLYARRTHKLPDPITLNDGTLFIWLREDVQPYLDAWKIVLDTRRGH
jgi:predicted DNA-binding transcriptional regulator AlpA